MTALTREAAKLSQWMTTRALARQIVRWSDVGPGMRVLEPSAGSGSIVRELADCQPAHVIAVEIDPVLTCGLRDTFGPPDPVKIVHGDFLSISPMPVDLAVLNPPYESGQDLAFVLRCLEWAPRVVALLRLVFIAGTERYRELWAQHTLSRLAILPARPRFSNTTGTPRHDFAVFEIKRGRTNEPTQLEWWG